MPQAEHTIHFVTSDGNLSEAARAAAMALTGWRTREVAEGRTLLDEPPHGGDLVLVDAVHDGTRSYELVRSLTGHTHCRIYLVVESGNELAEPIARFCGAAGVLELPFSAEALAERIAAAEPTQPLPHEVRGLVGHDELPERLLRDLAGETQATGLLQALIDGETGLFNYAFLAYKLDEEFKRAKRFDDPLTCLLLGFEGQASADILRQLAGIFLQSSRDTDILGRFDESSFLFLLPKTGPDGAATMARRVAELVQEKRLKDLVGDPLIVSVGISCYPDAAVARRDDLFGRARDAFLAARSGGGGVVIAS